jgi:hypothetical protein
MLKKGEKMTEGTKKAIEVLERRIAESFNSEDILRFANAILVLKNASLVG